MMNDYRPWDSDKVQILKDLLRKDLSLRETSQFFSILEEILTPHLGFLFYRDHLHHSLTFNWNKQEDKKRNLFDVKFHLLSLADRSDRLMVAYYISKEDKGKKDSREGYQCFDQIVPALDFMIDLYQSLYAEWILNCA